MNSRALRRCLAALWLAASLPLWAAEPREINWDALIPPDAPHLKPVMTPMHDLSKMGTALAESAPPAAQQAPHAPVVQALDGQQLRIPGYIVPTFCWCPITAPASTCRHPRRTRSSTSPANWG
jgi:hypothetical protein